jgi:hypothetical protein
MYEIEEVELRGPNMLLFQLVSGATRWYIMGCYILPTNLTTLMQVKKAWLACPKGCLPILLGDLNVNLAAPCHECTNTIAKQVDAMALVNMSNIRSRKQDDFDGASNIVLPCPSS